MKKCLKLVASGWKEIPGTGSVWIVFVYLTMRGLGWSIFVDYYLIIMIYIIDLK